MLMFEACDWFPFNCFFCARDQNANPTQSVIWPLKWNWSTFNFHVICFLFAPEKYHDTLHQLKALKIIYISYLSTEIYPFQCSQPQWCVLLPSLTLTGWNLFFSSIGLGPAATVTACTILHMKPTRVDRQRGAPMNKGCRTKPMCILKDKKQYILEYTSDQCRYK